MKYIREQLDSIVYQTYPIYELIIQDDCSTDQTIDIIKEYCSEYSFIHLFQNKSQKGINSNFFSAMERATGDFIAISDQDDIWELDKIGNQVNAIGTKLFCTGFSKPFYMNSEISPSFDQRIPNYNLVRFLFIASLGGHTFLFRRSFLKLVPMSDKFMSWFLYDVILLMTAAAYDSIIFVDKILVNCRRHSSAATYSIPMDYSRTPKNGLKILTQTYRSYRELRPFVKERLQQRSHFISLIPEKNSAIKDALKMAEVQMSGSFIKRVWISIQMRDKIFYAKEKRPFFAILRAIYFPIYCCVYVRQHSKNYK